MKRKCFFVILLILCSLLVVSCDNWSRFHYSGEDDELYSAVIYAIPACGYVFDVQTEVLETDAYGRTLFEVTAKDTGLFKNTSTYLKALMIVQWSDASGAGYYQDVCYSFTNGVDEVQISRKTEELKMLNDWEQSLNPERMINIETVSKRTMARSGEYNLDKSFKGISDPLERLEHAVRETVPSSNYPNRWWQVYDLGESGERLVFWHLWNEKDLDSEAPEGVYCIQFVRLQDGKISEPYQLTAKSLDELQTKIMEGRVAFGWTNG